MDLNRIVAYSLRIGVFAGAMLSLTGLVLWALQSFPTTDPDLTKGFASLLLSGFEGNVAGLVYLGVTILIATPVFRVALSVAYFAVERDKRYVGITILVLAMLVLALVSGAA